MIISFFPFISATYIFDVVFLCGFRAKNRIGHCAVVDGMGIGAQHHRGVFPAAPRRHGLHVISRAQHQRSEAMTAAMRAARRQPSPPHGVLPRLGDAVAPCIAEHLIVGCTVAGDTPQGIHNMLRQMNDMLLAVLPAHRDARLAPVKVDVLPAQPKRLTDPRSGAQYEDAQRAQAMHGRQRLRPIRA